MGINITTSPDQYETAFRKLFPRGNYWDKQFADPQSDASLFCKAKLPEFIRFRCRMAALQNESKPHSALELLDDWERVLHGSVFHGLNTQQRQLLLLQKNEEKKTRSDILKIAGIFGFIITDVRLPYRPAFFGFNRFGIERIANPAAWQVIHIFVITQSNGDQVAQFEDVIRKKLLANHIPYFFYDGGKP
jgi:uncharacterized protein YmfQ (DUF2313 family)